MHCQISARPIIGIVGARLTREMNEPSPSSMALRCECVLRALFLFRNRLSSGDVIPLSAITSRLMEIDQNGMNRSFPFPLATLAGARGDSRREEEKAKEKKVSHSLMHVPFVTMYI